MKGLLLGICILVLLGIGGFLINQHSASPVPFVPNTSSSTLAYTSPIASISFNYPSHYNLNERKDGFEGQPISVITLVDKDVVVPDMSDGPTLISIISVPNPTNLSLEEWVKTKSISNFNLSADQKLTPTTVAGEAAVAYTHSGLYESDAVAWAHGDKIYVASVGWASATDPIRTDFQNVIKSVQLK